MAEQTRFPLGVDVRDDSTFYDFGDQAADPAVIKFIQVKPTGAPVTFTFGGGEIVKDSVGHYHVIITVDQLGTWRLRWDSDSPNAFSERTIVVE